MAGNSIVRHFSKPSGRIGRLMLWRMNWHHSRLTDWGLAQIAIPAHGAILDIGCGGGRTLRKLAAASPQSKVCGIDHADASIAASRKNNARAIQAGQVHIQQASVSELPFPDDSFDLITAVETHFFWPSLPSDIREVVRVLRRGGAVILIAELYKGTPVAAPEKVDRAATLIGMNLLTAEEHRALLADAGCVDVRVVEKRDKGWICVFGRKAV